MAAGPGPGYHPTRVIRSPRLRVRPNPNPLGRLILNAMSELLQRLAVADDVGPVLSLYLRTDPREPANKNQTPAWLVELRNGMRGLARRLDEDGPREERLALRELSDRIEDEVIALDPAKRARGLAWFIAPGGGLDHRLSLQLPPRENHVIWDSRPFVSPLVDVADRGRPTGLVLVGGDVVRLLHWEAGRVSEPERSIYELELGDWREYAAYAASNPARGQQTATNVEAYRDRVEEWRDRFLRAAAAATGGRLQELGWDRVLLISEGQVATRFAEDLPDEVLQRVAATVTGNLLGAEPAAVAEHLETELSELWRRHGQELATLATDAAAAGERGAAGWSDVLDCLVQGRVEHLILAAGADPPRDLAPATREALGDPSPEMLLERSVERAIELGAEITMLSPEDSALLADAGGAAAVLRF